jgi:hypothetical protein
LTERAIEGVPADEFVTALTNRSMPQRGRGRLGPTALDTANAFH